MYITPYQKKQLTTIFILVLGIPLTLFAIYTGAQWFTSAGANTQPKDVILANLTTNSVVVTWTTSDEVIGSVIPVLNGTEGSPVIDKRGSGKRNTHYVEIKSLEPGTEYDFKIISGEDTYVDVGGTEFEFSTANISADIPTPTPVHGILADISDDDALIYILPKDKTTYPAATVPSSNGNWLVDLSSLRRIEDKSMYTVLESTDLVVIGVSSIGNAGVVEGQYGIIFDSSKKLTETLVSSGTQYDIYISEDTKLVATEDKEEEPTVVVDKENETPYVPPVVVEQEVEETFDKEYELKNDLIWTNLVSSEGVVPTQPDEYGTDSVMVTNLTDVGCSIIWFSQESQQGHVMSGTSISELSDKGRDERDGIASQGEYFLHSIEITQLQPETTYYFEIYSGEETYEYEGEITTFATQSSPPQFETIVGTLEVDDYKNALVVATFVDNDGIGSKGTSHPISTLVDSEGSWILTIGGARDSEGEYFDKSNDDKVNLSSKYFTNSSATEMTIGEATSEEIGISTSSSSDLAFSIIPSLSDYGVLVD
ncbi:fibronectin type III domain-containing protein [bacterium]|nr:fibronectin type III domain-containing protein [bacterium]